MGLPKKIIVNGRFLGGGATAVNAVADDLTSALVDLVNTGKTNWSVEVAVPQPAADLAREKSWPLRVVGRRSGILWEQTEFARLRHEGVLTGFFNTVPLWGTGYVTMLHDAHVFTTPQSYGRATRLWRQILSRRAGATENRLLTVSEYSRESLLRLKIGTLETIGVVPNGLGKVGFVEADHAATRHLGLQAPFVLAPSSLLPHKNLRVLLKAFEDNALSAFTLVLYGKAGRSDYQAAGLNVPENVVFTGFVTDAALASLYLSSLCLCVPSTEEGFGLPALEGMARGVPTIVAPCGALPEVVGDAGLFANPTDSAEWVAAIRSLHDDPALRAQLVEKGRQRATSFTWRAAAQRVIDMYDRWFQAA